LLKLIQKLLVISQDSYSELRSLLKRKGRSFLYETNVGAGLPLIDTLKNLLRSADKVERIRGVFSGSLSYLFNTFCAEERSFSDILLEAKKNGLTEPDPREDLSGLDVARKLLILAREVGLSVEFEEVEIQGLVPDRLYNTGDFDDFMKNRTALDRHYSEVMSDLNEGEVLRYVGDLDVSNGLLKVALERVKITSPLGGLKEADSLFEIYTTSYGDHPMVIQGAGAGAEVTARGVYSDVIKIGMLI